MDYDQSMSDILHVEGDVKLLIRGWLPDEEPKAVMLAIHGGLAHCGDHGTHGLYFKNRSIATYAIDLRWHGTFAQHNPGEKVYFHCNSYDQTARDIAAFHRWIRVRHPHIPLFVIGHSNGALISLYYGLTLGLQSDIRGFALSSPWLKNKVVIPKILLTFLKVVSLLHPTFAVTPASLLGVLNHDKKIMERQLADCHAGLYGTQVTARLGAESMKTQKWVIEHMAEWQRYPLFVVIAGQDALADPQVSVSALSKVRADLVTMVMRLNNFHENFNELDREQTFAQIERWMLKLIG